MYKTENRIFVPNGQILRWVLEGEHNIALLIKQVTLPDGRQGIILDQERSSIPDSINVAAFPPATNVNYKGAIVWIKDQSSFVIVFNGNVYELFSVKNVGPEGVDLYFHTYVPKPYGDGVVVYTEAQWLESW